MPCRATSSFPTCNAARTGTCSRVNATSSRCSPASRSPSQAPAPAARSAKPPSPRGPGSGAAAFLHQPAVVVGVAERHERPVVLALGVEPGLLSLRPEVEEVADVDPALVQLGTGRLDVVDDEGRRLRRPGCGGGQTLADDDRARRPRRSQLHDAEVLVGLCVDVGAEAGLLVEGLGTVDVGDRQHHDFELVVQYSDRPLAQTPTRSSACSARRRAMTRRQRVSSAPSKIESTRASTKYLDTGNSSAYPMPPCSCIASRVTHSAARHTYAFTIDACSAPSPLAIRRPTSYPT